MIVTSLLGRWVVPDYSRDPDQGRFQNDRQAQILAVFVDDGRVWFLVERAGDGTLLTVEAPYTKLVAAKPGTQAQAALGADDVRLVRERAAVLCICGHAENHHSVTQTWCNGGDCHCDGVFRQRPR